MTQHDFNIAVTGPSLIMPTICVSPEVEATIKKAHYANVSNIKTNRKNRSKFRAVNQELKLHILAIRVLSTQLDLTFAALERSRRRQLLLFFLLLFNTAAIVYTLYERLF